MEIPALQSQPRFDLRVELPRPQLQNPFLRPLAHFGRSPTHEADEQLITTTATPFRIARGQVGFWCGLNRAESGLLDHAAGSDLIWWSGPIDSPTVHRIAVCRNAIETNPVTGKPSLFMRFPESGGFVPTDERLADGRPHPAAGTGFSMCHVCAVPLEVLEEQGDRSANGTWAHQGTVYRCLEVRQIRFDSASFCISDVRRYHFDELLPGWLIQNVARNAAVVDGEALLWPLACAANSGQALDRFDTKGSIGVTRWGFRDGCWGIQSIEPVDSGFRGYEPSLIRTGQGGFSLTARIDGPPDSWDKFSIPVWTSGGGGSNWKQAFRAERHRANSPLLIGSTATGQEFIVGNLMVGGMNQRSLGYSRELLALWMLRPDGSGLESSKLLRCGQLDFGEAPTQHGWKLDHPSSTVIEDSEGQRVCLLTYRVQASDENRLKEVGPTRHSGVYVEQILLP